MNRPATNFSKLAYLPSMPVVLLEALQHIGKQQQLEPLLSKIGQDPALTIRILRIANSPFYGMSREIGSLREAVVLLGTNRVREMIIGVCFAKLLTIPDQDFDYRNFWQHSLAVAECARQLAIIEALNPESAFTAGLLHNIGALVMAILYPAHVSDASETISLGSEAALYWHLPRFIQEAIEQHTIPPAPSASLNLNHLIYLACALTSAQQDGESVDADVLDLLRNCQLHPEQAMQCRQAALVFAEQIIGLF